MRLQTKTTGLFMITGLLMLAQLLVWRPALAAGTASVYLSPASATIVKDKTITINVYENSGTDSVNAVQANLTYSTSKLAYVSYTTSSAFNIEAENPSGNTGSLHFARGTITPRTGAQLIVSIVFKAVASSGTTAVNFASGTSVIRYSDNGSQTLTTTGGNYTLTAPASSSSGSSGSTSGSGGSSSSSSSSSSTTKTPAKTVALKISDVKVSSITQNSATVSWKTSAAASSVINFGETTAYGVTKTNSHLSTTHQFVLSGANEMIPGNTYHFRVKSVDAKGNSAVSKDATFKTLAAGQKPAVTKPSSNNGGSSSSKLGAGTAAVAVLAVIGAGTWWVRRWLHSRPAKPAAPASTPDTSSQLSPSTVVKPATGSSQTTAPKTKSQP